MTIFRISIFLIGFSFLIPSCAQKQLSDSMLNRNTVVDEYQMFINNKLAYEIVGVGQESPVSNCFNGLAIHSVKTDKYKWISPREGWRLIVDGEIIDSFPEIKEKWSLIFSNRATLLKGNKKISTIGKEFHLAESRCEPEFSSDGKYITFSKRSLLTTSMAKKKLNFRKTIRDSH